VIIVSDTSAISALIRIGKADLLPQLFEETLIPIAVRDELLRWHTDLPSFLSVRKVRQTEAVTKLCGELDIGESEAITLTQEVSADLLLLEEKKGGAFIATQRGPKVVRLPGVLLLAKRRGLLPNIAAALDSLERIAGFRVAASVREAVLHEAGES